MRRFLRFTAGLLIASAFALGAAACGGGGGHGFVPAPTGPQALNFTSFTVSPSTLTAGSSATLQWGLSNPGANSTSNVNLQAYISASPMTLSSVGQPGVSTLGAPQTISAIPPGQSSSGSFMVTITPPAGVTPPAAVFVMIVATPTTSGGVIANASPSVQVQVD
jgi:hypothetical protein